jgi:integrase/recombinase XerD
MTNWDYLEKYLEHFKLQGYSYRSQESYRSNLNRFYRHLEARGKKIRDLTRADLQEYQSELYYQEYRGKPLSAKTQSLNLSVLRMFFKYLAAENLILTDPAATLELPKEPKRLPRTILTAKEAQKILEAIDTKTAKGIRDRAMLEVFYSSGIRVDELIHLSVTAINLEEGFLTVEKGKGDRERVVPLGKIACHWVKEYLEKARPKIEVATLFLSLSSGKPLTRSVIAEISGQYALKAGIKKRITPHTWRHTCATLMLKGRADIRYVQELLGHASLKTTQIYTKVTIQDLKKVHSRCHPRD